MFGIGVPELVVILVIALVVFGPGKLPEIGGALGKGIRDFKKAFDSTDDELKKVTSEPEGAERPRRSPSGLLPASCRQNRSPLARW